MKFFNNHLRNLENLGKKFENFICSLKNYLTFICPVLASRWTSFLGSIVGSTSLEWPELDAVAAGTVAILAAGAAFDSFSPISNFT